MAARTIVCNGDHSRHAPHKAWDDERSQRVASADEVVPVSGIDPNRIFDIHSGEG